MKNAIRALFVMLLSASSLAYGQSTTNSIYIDQVGDQGAITLSQKGQNNRIGTEQARFQIGGDGQLVNIRQNGSGNKIDGKIVDADNIEYGVEIIGDDNELNIDQGDAGSVAGSKLVLDVVGSTNTLTLNQGTAASSTNADQAITITGDQNQYTSTINADDVKNEITITGDSNTTTMLQNGYQGKEVKSTVTGNNNTINLSQTSTLNVDKIDITHTGNNSAIAISQCNASGGC